MDDVFPLSEARSQFEHTKHHLETLVSDPVFINYFRSRSEFQEALSAFFNISDDDLQRLYYLGYPLNGQIFFNHIVLVRIVQLLPELLLSVLREGVSRLITLYQYQDDEITGPVPIDYSHLRQISETIFFIWRKLGEIEVGGANIDVKLQDLEGVVDSLHFSAVHYDLLGCFQINFLSQLLYIQSTKILDTKRSASMVPRNSRKRKLLTEIVGYLAMPVRGADSVTLTVESLENFDEHLYNYLLGHQFISGVSNALNVPAQIEADISVKELTVHYGSIDCLVLHLPEDQTTDQSLIYLDLLSSDKKVAGIELSHMEAAFLYYLGAERNAKETLWLSFPEKQSGVLRKIWKSFCLPEYFEDELALIPPIKGITKTWIWDFDNTNRKSLRHQIQKKIKAILSESLRFNLIGPYKSTQTPYGGNYKLNTQITSFEISKPSR